MAKSKTIVSRFRGRSEHVLDVKGRLNFPSRFREVLQQYESEQLMVTSWGSHLRAFPATEWETLEDKLLAKGREQPGLTSFVRLVVSGVTPCLPDRQGRILMPPTLRSETRIVKEVVLTGMLDYVEIWDKDAWLIETQATRENFADYNESLAKLGIF
ncbi:MAG: division/cell wall cluster transcriptional repressor MraZ [Desulfobulbaceae bacterium]|uniref:Transcriptional regulator MraZ n=1 Tax=Candidatus Desulfatifera sulfidica TaxID=2841691 RepID=A0A8J6N911_9BACT|nr:division/cell wall cluster transcriptional repressor MraZ [Candidatus Desulfatifera sulfidica]